MTYYEPANSPKSPLMESRFEYGELSLQSRAKPLQQDVVRVGLTRAWATVVICDGMTNRPGKGADVFPELVLEALKRIDGAPSSLLLSDVMQYLHQLAVELQAGAALAIIHLNEHGVCHFAVCGDIAIWADTSEGDASPRWEVLNTSAPHSHDSPDRRERLNTHLGQVGRGPEILHDCRRGVRGVIGMTDGWYNSGKTVGADRGWHPSEPPSAGTIGPNVTPTAWLVNNPPYMSSNDNLSAFYLRRVERPVREKEVVRTAADPVLRAMAALCVTLASATAAVAVWRVFWG